MTNQPSSITNAKPDVAIVVGSSSGVGAATVRLMLARGVHVLGIDRSKESPALTAGSETRYVHLVAHAGEKQTWPDALKLCRSRFGADPNAVVFCAAVLVIGSVVTLSEEHWQSVFETNVFGPARALKHLIPRMAARGGGSVVFVNSSDGHVGEQNLAAYCASKGAGLQLMRAVALDHARQGIRSNAVCPGSIQTPFFMKHVEAAPDPDAFLKAKTDRHPAGRLLQPEDVASVIDFLASPVSLGMTGAALPVDGGLTAGFDFYVDQADKESDESARRFAELPPLPAQ